MKRIESGLYENETHRIYQNQSTTVYTYAGVNRDSCRSRKELDWVLVNKATGRVTKGIETLTAAKKMMQRQLEA